MTQIFPDKKERQLRKQIRRITRRKKSHRCVFVIQHIIKNKNMEKKFHLHFD